MLNFKLLKFTSKYCLTLFLLTSCTGNTIYKKPEDLIPRDTMINLYTDLYLANSAKNVVNINEDENISYIPLIYAKYGVDSTRFNSSNVYYMSNINLYESMQKSVLANIDRLIKPKDSVINKDTLKIKNDTLLNKKANSWS